jgi:hypothetical protein
MAVYKVPQDVEAEDKLIGPFSFRQFGYLFAVAIFGFVLFLLFTQAPLVVALFFLVILGPPMAILIAISLPLKKDQPMETYMIAVVRFFLKPRVRLWLADGSMAMVEITAPKTVDAPLTKAFSGSEANNQLAYLAGLMDSRGWSAKGVAMAPSPGMVVSDDAPDVLDDANNQARSFDTLLAQNDNQHHQRLVAAMHQQPVAAAPLANPQQIAAPTLPNESSLWDQAAPQFQPYPNMHQHVVSPNSPADTPPAAPILSPSTTTPATSKPLKVKASTKAVTPDIIRLAENKDLSISAIAHEANRLQKKSKDDDEVVISLR